MQQRWDASEGFSSVQVFDVTAEPMRHYIQHAFIFIVFDIPDIFNIRLLTW